MTYIIHSAATKRYEAGAASSIATAPAHSDTGAYLRTCYLIVCYSLSFLAAVRIRTCKLDGVALPNESRHTLEFSHLFLSDVVRVFHHIFIVVVV